MQAMRAKLTQVLHGDAERTACACRITGRPRRHEDFHPAHELGATSILPVPQASNIGISDAAAMVRDEVNTLWDHLSELKAAQSSVAIADHKGVEAGDADITRPESLMCYCAFELACVGGTARRRARAMVLLVALVPTEYVLGTSLFESSWTPYFVRFWSKPGAHGPDDACWYTNGNGGGWMLLSLVWKPARVRRASTSARRKQNS